MNQKPHATPDEQQIEKLLAQIQPVPGARFYRRMENAPWVHRPQSVRGNLIMNTKLRLTAIALLLLIAVASLWVITPQGRAFAETLFGFFVPAQATSFPAPPVSNASPEANNVASTVTYETIEEAESAVGFSIRHFVADPQGFTFSVAEVDLAQPIVYLHYSAEGGELVLAQGLSNFPPSPWSEVPPEAIEPAPVGGNPGEYAQGTFVVFPDAESATWEAAAPVFRLHWSDGVYQYALEKSGDTQPIEWLDKAALIRLAEMLMANP